ncbi:MAG: flagellar biosynthesis protein FlhF [Planctomycetota bacterium]
MLVRSFTGRTMPEALEQVRRSLGERALIIETRTLREPGLLGRRSGVEVVAAVDHAEQRPSGNTRTSARIGALQPRRPAEDRPDAWRRIDLPTHLDLPDTPAPVPQHQGLIRALDEQHDLSHELATIRRQLARMARGEGVPSSHIGENWLSELEEQELPAEHIAEIDEAIAQAGVRLPADRRRAFAARLLGRRLHTPGPVDWDRCRQLLMVGPTGVGKTTTIAKLAGDLALRQGRRIALITIDTYRVGAADQLRAYADLLDVPCEVAQTPAQLAAALQRFADYDNVLIDTAGRSPADAARVHELKGFCRAAPGMGVLLAVGATCGRPEFAAVVERFSILPVEYTVITKFDECVAPGRLYGCLRRHRLPVNWITTGQEVPEDIRPAAPELLVDPICIPQTSRSA